MEINNRVERLGGVYYDRMLKKNMSGYKMVNTPEERRAAEELKAKMQGVKVTISPDSLEYLAGVKERKEAEKAAREHWEKERSLENSFERIGTHFQIFSSALEEKGFYDNMSDEEVLEVESILGDITHSLNGLFGTVKIYPNDDGEELSSHAARLEVESATAAMRKFSNKYVPEEMREFFNGLIDQYYEFNSKKLESYRSSEEAFNELNAEFYDKTESSRVIPLNKGQRASQLAGKVKISKEDKEMAVKKWRKCLNALAGGRGGLDEMIGEMSNILKKFASGNSENKLLLDYVEQWN